MICSKLISAACQIDPEQLPANLTEAANEFVIRKAAVLGLPDWIESKVADHPLFVAFRKSYPQGEARFVLKARGDGQSPWEACEAPEYYFSFPLSNPSEIVTVWLKLGKEMKPALYKGKTFFLELSLDAPIEIPPEVQRDFLDARLKTEDPRVVTFDEPIRDGEVNIGTLFPREETIYTFQR